MWTERFVRSLKYDAVPRTTVLIELFNSVIAVTFNTTHGTESHYVNCTERVVIPLKSLLPTAGRPCRIESKDS